MKRAIGFALIAAMVIGAVGCAVTNTKKGAAIGGTAGAIVGGIVGDRAGNTAAGVLVGAAVGGTTGAIIGHYMDEQAAELEQDLEGTRVDRVGEGIKITFDSGILFDYNKADLRPAAKDNLVKMAEVLNKYDDTNILIEGHTDADGSEEYNQKLSERRAASVSGFLAGQGVAGLRMTTVGHGKTMPIADNSTAEGRQANRRVEVAIFANEDLKKAAEKQAAEG
ncbi:MAG: OmpA family protein [Candidatus Eisenbacteria bacterium]